MCPSKQRERGGTQDAVRCCTSWRPAVGRVRGRETRTQRTPGATRLLAVALGANKRLHMTRIPHYPHGKSMNHACPITTGGAKRRRATGIGRAFLRKATGPVRMPHDSTTVVCGETTYLCVSPLAWPVACGGLLPSLIPCLSSLFCKRSHVFAGSNEAPDILAIEYSCQIFSANRLSYGGE